MSAPYADRGEGSGEAVVTEMCAGARCWHSMAETQCLNKVI